MAWVGAEGSLPEAKVPLPPSPPSLPSPTRQHQGSEHELKSERVRVSVPARSDLWFHPGSLTLQQCPSGAPPVLTQVPPWAGTALQTTQERSGCWGPELCAAAALSGPLQTAWPIHLPAATAAMPPPGIELGDEKV